MSGLLERVGFERPIVQAGMGGGLATSDLAAAVSGAGGLGTVGIMSPARLEAELRRAGALAPGRPIAVNLLMPFVRPAHVGAAIRGGARLAVLFCGHEAALVARLRAAGMMVLHQVGTLPQALRALADGADGLVAQGSEAGGHLLGRRPALEFLRDALEVADGRPVLLAGGVSGAAHMRAALDAGADAVMVGTRFLLTTECRAHPAYQQRVLGARETLATYLFGFGWPERHRVVPNDATERWCVRHPDGPRTALALNRATASVGRRLPLQTLTLLPRLQRVGVPLLSPGPALAGMPDAVVETTPLYAGTCARDILSVVPAAQAVAELTAQPATTTRAPIIS